MDWPKESEFIASNQNTSQPENDDLHLYRKYWPLTESVNVNLTIIEFIALGYFTTKSAINNHASDRYHLMTFIEILPIHAWFTSLLHCEESISRVKLVSKNDNLIKS